MKTIQFTLLPNKVITFLTILYVNNKYNLNLDKSL